MDDKGYWHDVPAKEDGEPDASDGRRQRYVFSAERQSTVEIILGGERMLCIFEDAAKNKVMLKPIDEWGKPRMELHLGQRVILSNGADAQVPAEVWETRGGKLILRTVPVG